MFSRGTSELIDALPSVEGLDSTWVRRRLSEAYLEVLATRQLVSLSDDEDVGRDIRRLVNALEVYVIRAPSEDIHISAASFVAAEALEIWASRAEVEDDALLRIEAALLFVIAGFDANAAAIAPTPIIEIASMRDWALRGVAAFLEQTRPEDRAAPEPGDTGTVERAAEISGALWRRIGNAVRAHHMWLRGAGDEDSSPGRAELSALTDLLESVTGATERYAGPVHLLRLLAEAAHRTEGRALRQLSRVPSMTTYVDGVVEDRPLLWPGARIFAERCVEELGGHAAVAVPTGSGKSAIAELAIARAASEGWCLYLAPTNALVGQVRRDLRSSVAEAAGDVRSFVGGGEYTTEEAIEHEVGVGDVFVMTPEKCALALRQSPERFANLRLLVLDECHLIGAGGNRGVVVELVVSEILSRAPFVSVLLMSALVSNADELAGWLEDATGKPAIAIAEPWRPTRTMRGVVGISKEGFDAANDASIQALEERPNRVSRHQVPLRTMVGLQGAWATTGAADDFAVVGLPATVEAQFRTTDPDGDVEGWRNRAAESLSVALAAAGEHVLTFIPANKHEVISVGRAVATELPERDLARRIDDHIALAEYELGQESEVGDLLRHGVATHSAALIEDERRASELAFSGRTPFAPIMVATTSLAQGLNLPATVVVVAGTQIGQGGQGQARTARDLLNAIGRAGRPFVANRSLALIIPSQAALLGLDAPPANVLSAARFIGLEDASGPLESQLVSLLRQSPERLASLDAMTEEELAAFTYLPLREEDDVASEILRRSFGHYQRRLEIGPAVEDTLGALQTLGTNFLEAGESPAWLVEVAYVSGIDLRAVAGLYRAIGEAPAEPSTPTEWTDALLRWTATLGARIRELLCNLEDVPEPLLRGLRGNDENAWGRLAVATRNYLRGSSLAEIGELAFEDSREDGRRSSGDPLPKAIALVRQILSYRLSMAAGALFALFERGRDREDPRLQVSPESLAALEQCPLSLRVGCDTRDARLWARYGFTGRRLAHLLARLHPVPPALMTEAALRNWMRTQLEGLGEDLDAMTGLEAAERRAVVAAASARIP